MQVELAVAALRRRRAGLVVWVASLASLVAVIVAFYPSIKGDLSLDESFSKLPDTVRAFLGSNSIISPVGYLTSRLFGWVVPALLIAFMIGRGTAAIAGEEEQHTLNLVLAYPVARRSAVAQRLAAMCLELVLLAAILWLTLVLISPVSQIDIGIAYETAAVVQCAMLALTFGVLALAIGAATGRRSSALGIASGLAVVGYIVDSLSRVVQALRPLRPFTVWRWYDGHQPLTDGIDPVGMSVLIVLAVIAVVVGIFTFERRDVRE
ncbi:MAG: beta-exotoxin transport system permease protein [Acidimicrobiaceae bacterium]